MHCLSLRVRGGDLPLSLKPLSFVGGIEGHRKRRGDGYGHFWSSLSHTQMMIHYVLVSWDCHSPSADKADHWLIVAMSPQPQNATLASEYCRIVRHRPTCLNWDFGLCAACNYLAMQFVHRTDRSTRFHQRKHKLWNFLRLLFQRLTPNSATQELKAGVAW